MAVAHSLREAREGKKSPLLEVVRYAVPPNYREGEFAEALRICERSVLDTELERIRDKLLSAIPKLKTYPVPVTPEMLVVDDDGYAFTNPDIERAFVATDKNMFIALGTEDRVAFLVGHELGHLVYRTMHNLGVNVPVSFLEEYFCDKFSWQLLKAAGYSQEAAADAFEIFRNNREKYEKYSPLRKLIQRISDEHPPIEHRINYLRDDLYAVAREAYGEEIQETVIQTPIADNIVELATITHHTSWLDQVLPNYSLEASVAKNLNELADEYHGITNPGRRADFHRRLKTIHNECKGVLDEESLLAINRIAESICNESLSGRRDVIEFFDDMRAVTNLFGDILPHVKLLPLGPFQNIRESLIEISQAEDDIGVSLSIVERDSDALKYARLREPAFWKDNQLTYAMYIDLDYPIKIDYEALARACESDTSGVCARYVLECLTLTRNTDEFLEILSTRTINAVLKGLPNLSALASNILKNSSAFVSKEIILAGCIKRELKTRNTNGRDPLPVTQFWNNKRFLLHTTVQDNLRVESELERIAFQERIERGVEDPKSQLDYMGSLAPSDISVDEAEKEHLASKAYQKSFLVELEKGLLEGGKRKDKVIHFFTHDPVSTGRWSSQDVRPWQTSCYNTLYSQFVESHLDHFSGRNRIDIFLQHSRLRRFEVVKALFSLQVPPLPPGPRLLEIFLPAKINSDRALDFVNHCLESFPKNSDNGYGNGEILACLGRCKVDQQYCASIGLRDRIVSRIWPDKAILDPFIAPDSSPMLLARAYLGLIKSDLSPSPEHRLRFGEIMLEAISKDPKANRSLDILEELLASHLPDPEIRNGIQDLWINAAASELGKDSTALNSYRIFKFCENRLKTLPEGVKLILITELAEKVESQEWLSKKLKSLLSTDPKGAFTHNPLLQTAILVADTASDSPDAQAELIRFLTSPLTNESIDQAFPVLRDTLLSSISHYSKHRFGTDEEFSQLVHNPKRALYDLHKNFWELSITSRTYFFRGCLLNPSKMIDDREVTLKTATKITLDRLFSESDSETSHQNVLEKEWARDFLSCYLNTIPEKQLPLVLSGLLAATYRAREEGVLTVGRQLKLIFEQLGPFYIKLGQAIHSWPGTPEGIRIEMGDLKNKAARPPRWDLFDQINTVLPQRERRKIGWIGSIVGSASFYVTFKARAWTGREVAYALLRPFADERAEIGAKDLSGALSSLMDMRPQAERYRNDVLQLIEHARELSRIETSQTLSHTLYLRSRDLYDGQTVRGKGFSYSFKTAKWLSYGEKWRKMIFAKGTPPDELANVTEEERKGVLKAHLIVELRNILSGGYFDYDRHAKQSNVWKKRVSVFDPGGISLKLPSEEEKEHLADIIVQIGQAVLNQDLGSEDNIKDVVAKAFTNLRPQDNYLRSVQRALLALSFTWSNLDKDELLDCFRAALIHEDCDPVIGNTVSEGLGFKDEYQKSLKYSPVLRKRAVRSGGGTILYRRRSLFATRL